MNTHVRKLLRELYFAAVNAAQAEHRLAQFLPAERSSAVTVIGAGKAAASMAQALEAAWTGPVTGAVVTRYGHAQPTAKIEVIEAAHPEPDGASVKAADKILALAQAARADDTVIFLLSGGASSLLCKPARAITLEQKRQITHQLLLSGATIGEINTVRKHLSAIKGGRLAEAVAPAQLLTLAISDVPGDDPAVIGSGPTVADPSTCAEALKILSRHRIERAPSVDHWLASAVAETPKQVAGDYQLIATPTQSLAAAVKFAKARGMQVQLLGDNLEGEARALGRAHAELALKIRAQKPCTPVLLLSGGETSVRLSERGKRLGRGGRNGEYALGLAQKLKGAEGIFALAADTDGIDGSEDNAGAFVDPGCIDRAACQGVALECALADNTSYDFFNACDNLLITGPTHTNVNDFRALLVLPS